MACSLTEITSAGDLSRRDPTHRPLGQAAQHIAGSDFDEGVNAVVRQGCHRFAPPHTCGHLRSKPVLEHIPFDGGRRLASGAADWMCVWDSALSPLQSQVQ